MIEFSTSLIVRNNVTLYGQRTRVRTSEKEVVIRTTDGGDGCNVLKDDKGTKYRVFPLTTSSSYIHIIVQRQWLDEQRLPVAHAGPQYIKPSCFKGLWSECKIIHGRPRYPQSQGSVECCNHDVEIDDDRQSKHCDWEIGCYFVQWKKNCSKHIRALKEEDSEKDKEKPNENDNNIYDCIKFNSKVSIINKESSCDTRVKEKEKKKK
ncbi:hypothetical protein QTP88_003658 [Uroleucon formosanum]